MKHAFKEDAEVGVSGVGPNKRQRIKKYVLILMLGGALGVIGTAVAINRVLALEEHRNRISPDIGMAAGMMGLIKSNLHEGMERLALSMMDMVIEQAILDRKEKWHEASLEEREILRQQLKSLAWAREKEDLYPSQSSRESDLEIKIFLAEIGVPESYCPVTKRSFE